MSSFTGAAHRILEKLNSLPPGTLPAGVQPTLGPDATALGQIFWYTLEGRDPKTGKPNGGWDPSGTQGRSRIFMSNTVFRLPRVFPKSLQSEDFVKEYQVDLDPDAMKALQCVSNGCHECRQEKQS
ncbi:MAG: hypothetical protein MZV63_57065 [Marinilabiliales bacterium]|nr:hypothetical protein [Marinilabiliales bacterium]